ncbi:Glycolipid anchored surface protein 4 precursor [Purpureocillium takamizusanense]|uniref:1,3-beta-glucanosyltransferase n=1 Tax=Purpureocillium takamizusanense TaxID=2060973 RepID=A0A9Q8QHF4_9HYPO|nr:Glycolipid anchored surface protein 4 precursor [Purpureocillium takamizusanense]UNI19913.1 Glycolipid anchored surface protein 4 precursor [Purpureocillium takamizusanense]
MLFKSLVVALAATLVTAVPSLEVKGTDFVNPDTGKKFQIVGIAYQPGGSAGYDPKTGKDPLSHADTCLRDAALMQVIGVNTIRVYNLDPYINHDECASIFNAAGIYMIIDVNSPLVGEAITSFEPWTSYYAAYLNHTFAVVEAFSNYPNTLLYFSGNEVINNLDSAKDVPPYLRAVTRDIKNYIKKNIKRAIPVGYSAADVRDVLWDTWNYMQCAEKGEDDDMSRVDIFALNSYSWCGPKATYESSTFKELTDKFKATSVPVFFSEYGCNTPQPRYWNETLAIYGDKMTPVFSGGVVYQWTEEENNYGLVEVKDDTLTIMDDYNRLKARWAGIDWKTVQAQSPSNKKASPPECESNLILEKGFHSNFTLPDLPPKAQGLIDNGIKPKPSGKIVKVSDYNVKLTVKDKSGKTLSDLKVVPLKDDEFNWAGKNKAETGSASNSDNSTGGGDNGKSKDKDSAAFLSRPMMWAVALPLAVMMIFA